GYGVGASGFVPRQPTEWCSDAAGSRGSRPAAGGGAGDSSRLIAQDISGRVRVRYLGDEPPASKPPHKIPADPDPLSRFRPRSFRLLRGRVDIDRSPCAGRLGAVHPAPLSIAWPPTDRLPITALER